MAKQKLSHQKTAKLLVICGPTAVGKTRLGILLAKKLNGEIISADSRQVYRGLNIGTGKDLPKGAKLKHLWMKKFGYYEIGGIKVWGYDLADPRHGFNVSQYIKFAERVITDVVKRGKLPIIVGGTGLYIKGIVDGIPTAQIPRNSRLRENLEERPSGELYEMLAKMDSIKAAGMNSSDRKNPRRLIRAIEVATWRVNNIPKKPKKKSSERVDILQVGISANQKFLGNRIEKRVTERHKERVKEEIARLLKNHIDWDMQSMSSLGYRQWRPFFEGRSSEVDVIKTWEDEEKKYVKRQLTWFKKDKRINWFDVTDSNYPENVEKTVELWHNTDNNEKG